MRTRTWTPCSIARSAVRSCELSTITISRQLFVGGRDDDRELRVVDVVLGKVEDDIWIGPVDDPCLPFRLEVSQGRLEVTVSVYASSGRERGLPDLLRCDK